MENGKSEKEEGRFEGLKEHKREPYPTFPARFLTPTDDTLLNDNSPNPNGKLNMKDLYDREVSGQPPINPNQDPSRDPAVFSSVLYYCCLILVLPILAFFVTKMVILEKVLSYASDSVMSNVISAGVSVIILHVALGLFIYKAYFDSAPAKSRLGKQE